MGSDQVQKVAIQLPAEIIGQLNELKNDREQDRDKSVEALISEFCQTYIRVREMARWESANRDAIDRSYEENPRDMDDGSDWTKAYPREEDGKL